MVDHQFPCLSASSDPDFEEDRSMDGVSLHCIKMKYMTKKTQDCLAARFQHQKRMGRDSSLGNWSPQFQDVYKCC